MNGFKEDDCFQHKSGLITPVGVAVDSDRWGFLNSLNLGSSNSPFQPDFHIEGDIRLSDFCVQIGMFPSRSEFTRKLKEGAIKFATGFTRAKQVKQDVLINCSIPDGIEIRVKRKCCEIIVVMPEANPEK